MTIDITRFCATSDDPREYLRTPFRCPEGIVATNGHVLICLNDDGGKHPDAVEGMAGKAAKFKAYIDDPNRSWFFSASIALPDAKRCPECGGSGHVYEAKCEDCDGNGEFTHGRHDYECKRCGGNGVVHTDQWSGTKTTCGRCGGFGEDWQIVKVGNTAFQRKYLAMIVGLPMCRMGLLSEDPMGAAVFTFIGGFGVVMPCRE